MDSCEISRWQLIKKTLHNLDYEAFLDSAQTDENAILLDVRTPEEYKQNAIPNAVNVNYLSHDLADQLEGLDIDKIYYVYCRTGRRSLRVCVLLKNSGYQVINLDEGLISKQQ